MVLSYFISNFIKGGKTLQNNKHFLPEVGLWKSASCKDWQHFSHRNELLNTVLSFEESDVERSLKHSRGSAVGALL